MDAAEILVSLRERGVNVSLEGGKFRARPWVSLPPDLRNAVQKHWKDIIALLQAEGGPPLRRSDQQEPLVGPGRAEPKPKPQPEPEVYAYGQRVTELDVLDALTSLGDEAVADYREGRTSKSQAYEIARLRLRQMRQIGRARPVPV